MAIRLLKRRKRAGGTSDAANSGDAQNSSSWWSSSSLVWKGFLFSALTGVLFFVVVRYDVIGQFFNAERKGGTSILVKSARSSTSTTSTVDDDRTSKASTSTGLSTTTTTPHQHATTPKVVVKKVPAPSSTMATPPTTPSTSQKVPAPDPSAVAGVVQEQYDDNKRPAAAADEDYDPKAPLTTLQDPPTKRYHIFQFSGTGVASTMTVNLLTGLFEGREVGMAYWECKHGNKKGEKYKDQCTWWQRYNGIRGLNSPDLIDTTIVTKTHVQDPNQLQSWFQEDFDHLFFVGNERKDRNKFLPQQFCANDTYPNVICLEYNDLQYSDEQGVRKVVKYVKDRVYQSFPYFANVQLKEEEAVQRLLDMAESYKGTPGFDTTRYGIGGGNAESHTLETPNDNSNSEKQQEPFEPLENLEVAPSRMYHIFQFSGTGVASTMTVNLLTGLFEGTEQGMAYWECKHKDNTKDECTFWQRLKRIYGRPNASLINSTIVTKTHVQNVDNLQSWFGADFDRIFFIGNERQELNKVLPKEYCTSDTYPNVLCLEYNDLQYMDEEGMRKVVKYVKDRIQQTFPYFATVQLKEEDAVQRLMDMAESYKGNPEYNTNRYGIGGGNAKNHTLDGKI